ncbi:MAG: lipase maturation factor family protein [Polyangiales bacterium]
MSGAPAALGGDDQLVAGMRSGFFATRSPRYWLTRFVFLRALGFIYCVAFLVLLEQWQGLIGSHGILPAARFLERIEGRIGFFELPTLFVLGASDAALGRVAVLGLCLSVAVLLGVENALVMAALWAIYMSFCHIGQTFYGYGWEILLLETGFLAIFVCPLTSWRPLRSEVAPSPVALWLLRWLLFRLMFGAGLIKIRGDACWTDLSCLAYHYETQPVPGPLSWLLHKAPLWFHQAGVAFNHLVELVMPWLALGPRWARHTAGALTVLFQAMLIASGNLSFLNWLTIAVALACFDDDAFARILPRRLVERAAGLQAARRRSMAQLVVISLLALLVAFLSVGPVLNMVSPRQLMNYSFDPLHLCNTYGAFGSVSKVRNEVIVQGTRDARPTEDARWLEYEFPCKPGDVRRRPCLITPYHYRLDWQMWFAALGNVQREPWLLRFVYELLRAEPRVRALLARDPFGSEPPRYVRAELYEYRFTRWSERSSGYWRRHRVGAYLHPLSLADPELRRALRARGWLDPGDP